MLRSALDVLKRERRPLLTLNLVYFGLIACTTVHVSFNLGLQEALGQFILEALRAADLILAINLLVATFAAMTGAGLALLIVLEGEG
jgi:hypothetical protein